ncbi:MAG: UDP-N-acetylmuramoyl-L-alanyl-D-glutamate--2,6-diaminopimelate ligase [Planctomycetes bacterium]|nr:UDP-N-acetylmuramoyl-L-alanyl-D-glutamate--2,6-diaminopimelate ligase [Planctomycetota bacterium]
MTELAWPSGLQPRQNGTRLEDLIRVLEPVGVHRLEPYGDEPVTSLAYHSGEVVPGTLFFAVPGTRDDGARYVDDALERGVLAIVCERPMALKVPVIVVRDVRAALADAACAFYDDPSAQLATIGITGTNGKTTTTHLLRHVLELDGRPTGLLGTISYEFGGRRIPASNTTPDAVRLQGYLRDMVDRRVQACVMEVSSHALDQQRVRGVRFRAAVFTNLTQDHLDYHGSMAAYAKAKSGLFASLRPGGVAVLNLDSPATPVMYEAIPHGVRVVGYGRMEGATVRAADVRCSLDGTRLRLCMPHGEHEVNLPLPGEHNVENALAAAATALSLGVSEITIAHALETAPSVRGRMEPVGVRGATRVFIDYAHTPDAIEKACATLRNLGDGPLTIVFGCGGDRDRGKRPLMARAAAKWAERVFITSDNPRSEDPESILDEVERGLLDIPADQPLRIREYARITDRSHAIVEAVRRARADEMVLIAGKGHETYQILADAVVPFDDREWARKALASRD